MHDTMMNGTLIIATAVVAFVLFLIMLVIVLDHKARIPGDNITNIFQITGVRRNHPVWSYVIGTVLLIIISGVAVELGATMLNYIPIIHDDSKSVLLESLKEKTVLEGARHFHNPANTLALEGKKSVCYYCHGDFPHFKTRMIRTLLNMHTQFIGCMTCHVDSSKVDETTLTLRWLNFSGIATTGVHFGVDYDKETGFLVNTDDFYSKIVAYISDNKGRHLVEITEDDPLAVDFVKVQKELEGRDREAVKKSLHAQVMPKGRFCTRCHTKIGESYIPFQKLGFSGQRIESLTNLNIIGLVQKYKEFYMPDLMAEKIEPIEIKPTIKDGNREEYQGIGTVPVK